MECQKLTGYSLIGAAVLVLSGFLVQSPAYWEIVDIVVIAVCATSGAVLLRKKK